MPQRARRRKTRPDLGGRLRELRLARGLTQKQVGKLLEVDQSHVSKWEKRGGIEIENLVYLAVLYDASLDYIVRGVQPEVAA